MEQALQDYRDALEYTAQTQEVLATQLAMLAEELERQGQHQIAELLQGASRRHRALGLKNRLIAASVEE